jgi:hypothetical protein
LIVVALILAAASELLFTEHVTQVAREKSIGAVNTGKESLARSWLMWASHDELPHESPQRQGCRFTGRGRIL